MTLATLSCPGCKRDSILQLESSDEGAVSAVALFRAQEHVFCTGDLVVVVYEATQSYEVKHTVSLARRHARD